MSQPSRVGQLQGAIINVRPENDAALKEACARMVKPPVMAQASPHPVHPGVVKLEPITPPQPPAKPPAPDHQARLALIERIDRLLGYEKRVADLEAEVRSLEKIVARLAAENEALRNQKIL